MLQKTILFLLKAIAKFILTFHKPLVIWVTGTVGKSTITGHIWKFLSFVYGDKNVEYSEYHYNGEYGLPLTIIWEKSPWKNPFLWIYVIIKWISRIFRPFPKYLILEYWIDHPGEMDFLLSIVVPKIAILTEVAPNHLEQFITLENYRNEKLKLAKAAPTSIVHWSQKQYLDVEAVFYGIGAMSDIDVSHVHIDENGTHAQVHINKTTYHIDLPIFWAFQVENILPLYSIASIFWIDNEKIGLYLKNYTPESWRSGLVPWINKSIIVDGSYNGWYLSMREGIHSILPLLSTHKVILLLWDMRELGAESERIHNLLATDINSMIPTNTSLDLYLVGPLMGKYVAPLLHKSFQVHHTLSSRIAWKMIREELQKKGQDKTIIYVKWSQNTIFLEEGIKEFLDPSYDTHKLCRQSAEWIKKKNAFFDSL